MNRKYSDFTTTSPLQFNVFFHFLFSFYFIGDFSFMRAGNVYQNTSYSELSRDMRPSCMNSPVFVIRRNFQLPQGKNKISFEYKVDGSKCSARTCYRGFRFFVNDVQVLHSTYQFYWTRFETTVQQVGLIFFIYSVRKFQK